jgi:hypothetical protein
MEAWNETLERQCARYPNMRIYDWASDVKDDWFIEDGIHFTTPGYAARARLIADAVLDAFPAGVPVERTDNADCLIHPDGDPDSVDATATVAPSTTG